MKGKIIDGRKISKDLLNEIKEKINTLSSNQGIVPGLAVIYVGDDKASNIYVESIIKKCKKVGLYSEKYNLPKDTKEREVLSIIESLNRNKKINGIIVQFPIAEGIDENKIKWAVSEQKDVDCINPINVGRLYTNSVGFIPCTPKGVIKLIKSTGENLAGKKAVVVGRSNIVGKPVGELLLKEDLTVSICHSKTRNLEEYLLKADVVVAAAGRPNLVKGRMIKEGSIVIDVGTNVVDGKLVGDVEFEKAADKAAFITPVPGGVGPMTIAMLLENTLEACLRQCELKL